MQLELYWMHAQKVSVVCKGHGLSSKDHFLLFLFLLAWLARSLLSLSWLWACMSLRWRWTGRGPMEKVTSMSQSNQVRLYIKHHVKSHSHCGVQGVCPFQNKQLMQTWNNQNTIYTCLEVNINLIHNIRFLISERFILHNRHFSGCSFFRKYPVKCTCYWGHTFDSSSSSIIQFSCVRI